MLERTEARTSAAGVDPTTRTPPPFRFAVSRFRAMMVVTLHGQLDQHSAEGLIIVLRDVIYDQANRAVIVDLRDASGWAVRRGVSFRLYGPPAAPADALIGTWLAQDPGPDPPVGR